MKKITLTPADSHKSFYGKAYVLEDGATATLYSYGTAIVSLDQESGKVKKLWHGWSATTQRHINAFAAEYGVPGISGKAAWMAL